MQLISLVPTDPGILQRMGEIYDGEDRSQAFQYYYEVRAMVGAVARRGRISKLSLSHSPIATVRPTLTLFHGSGRITWSPSTVTKLSSFLTKPP